VHVQKIMEDLYDGTLDSSAWDRGILSIADAVRASGAILFAFNPSTGAVLRNENHRVDDQAVAEYARHWTFEDLRLPYCLTMPSGQPQTEVSLRIPLKQTAFYNEYLVPVDMPHFMPVWLHKSEERVVGLSFQGSLKRGAFEPDDVEIVRRFVPHLARAFEIRARLEAANVRAAHLAHILNATTFGVIVLDAQRKILEANAVAAALLLEESGLHCARDGVIRTKGPSGDRLLKRMNASVDCQSAVEALMQVPRQDKLPLSILVLPLAAYHTSWLSGSPTWVLLIFDPERPVAVNQQVFIKDLNLSTREAQVAALLVAGRQLDQIARRMHVTVHTVRSQLKSILHKTGCHTQAQLVRRLLLGPGFTGLV
jgi:DNA-binding CsgD family transcriptional regulator/PAS domain-containing protein